MQLALPHTAPPCLPPALAQGPGLIMLAILGWVASKVLGEDTPGWLEGLVAGLAAAGVALVASAALQLVRNICKGRLLQVRWGRRGGVEVCAVVRRCGRVHCLPSAYEAAPHQLAVGSAGRVPPCPLACLLPNPPQVLCTLAAVVAYYWPKPWTFPALIVIGGLITLVAKRKDVIQVGWGGANGTGIAGWGGAKMLAVVPASRRACQMMQHSSSGPSRYAQCSPPSLCARSTGVWTKLGFQLLPSACLTVYRHPP